MEDNSEPLINDDEDGKGSFSDCKEDLKRELRSHMEEANQEGERISPLFRPFFWMFCLFLFYTRKETASKGFRLSEN